MVTPAKVLIFVLAAKTENFGFLYRGWINLYPPRQYDHKCTSFFTIPFFFQNCYICIISPLFFFQVGLGDYITPPWTVSGLQWIELVKTSDKCLMLSLLVQKLPEVILFVKLSCLGQLHKHASETHKPGRPCSWCFLEPFIKTQGSRSSTFLAVGTSPSRTNFN